MDPLTSIPGRRWEPRVTSRRRMWQAPAPPPPWDPPIAPPPPAPRDSPTFIQIVRKTHKSPESFAVPVPVLSIGAEPSAEFPRRDDAITSFSQEFVCAALISSTRSGVRRFLSPETFPDRVAGSCSACRSCILWTKIHVYVRTQTQPPTFIGFSLDLKLSEETDFLLPFLKSTYLRRRLRKQLVNF